MKPDKLIVSTSPHLLGSGSVRSMHIEIIIALLPALAVGVYYYAMPAVITVALAVVAALASEVIIAKMAGLPNRADDLHAVLMGLLLGLLLPPGCPWWIPVIGGVLAVALGKLIYGGLGNYPFHPVLVAWAALSLSWPEHMAAFHEPLGWGAEEWEVWTTPLMELKDDAGTYMAYMIGNLWWGETTAAIGAGGAWALLLGGLYLVVRRIVPWQIPVGVLAGAAVLTLLAAYTDEKITQLGLETLGENMDIVWFHLGTGGLMIAAFFLAPEPVSSPMTPWGMFLFGLGVGLMAIIVRMWGGLVDGAFYGVLLMNAATPLFDRIRPKVLGKVVSGA